VKVVGLNAIRTKGEFFPSLPIRYDVPDGSMVMVSPCRSTGITSACSSFQVRTSRTSTCTAPRIRMYRPSAVAVASVVHAGVVPSTCRATCTPFDALPATIKV
jgi:hypothetical protein